MSTAYLPHPLRDITAAADLCFWWTLHQREWSWLWCKKFEPQNVDFVDKGYDGIRHKGTKSVEEISPRDFHFALRLAPMVLHNLICEGPKNLERLLEQGREMFRHGVALEKQSLFEPELGIPLQNGEWAYIEAALLNRLAFKRHVVWMQAREFTWTLPEALWQPKDRPAHRAWDPNDPNEFWRPDQGKTYGDALALAVAPSTYLDQILELAKKAASVEIS